MAPHLQEHGDTGLAGLFAGNEGIRKLGGTVNRDDGQHGGDPPPLEALVPALWSAMEEALRAVCMEECGEGARAGDHKMERDRLQARMRMRRRDKPKV